MVKIVQENPTWKVALFTHNFLEPTHHSIVQVLENLKGYSLHVFAKRFMDEKYFNIPNIESRTFYTKGKLSNLFDSMLVHAIYDGKTAIRAGQIAKEAGLPFLISFHGGFDTNAKIFDNRYTERTVKTVQQADKVTVTNHLDVVRLRKIGIKREINIIPVPIDFKILPKINHNRKNHELIIIGRLIPKKGFDIALKVLAELPKSYKLKIIGKGELENELLVLASIFKIQDRIEWLGELSLSETLNQLNESGILLHPARVANDGNAEGTPQIILWAQALRIPVITTSTGSISEIVKHETTGLIVESENIQQIIDAILKLNDEQIKKTITQNGFEQVSKNHSLDFVINQWLRLYENLIAINECR